MDHLHTAPNAIPHLLQVYQPSVSNNKIPSQQIIHISHPALQPSQGKVTYQQTITSESLHLPAASHITEIHNEHIHMSQNQIVMSCQQAHLQSIHQPLPHIPSQVLQSTDLQQLQITSHVILPQVPVFKQHVIVNGMQQQYYGQYESYPKEQCVVTKLEPEIQLLGDKKNDPTNENAAPINELNNFKAKKRRSLIKNPAEWICNIRKQKHQRGEAYISRRGKFVPERQVRTTKDCLKNCKFKCNQRISDADRETIFKAFYTLSTNEKKHFLLSTTERNNIKNNKVLSQKRKYSFKYFFLLRSVRFTVCKNFYLGTLAISQKPVYNVHAGKSDINIPKPDGRGLSDASTHPLPSEMKDAVRKHILSFRTVDSKPVKQFSRKKQYLESNLNIKQMYSLYVAECIDCNPVKESMYRKIFSQEFNLFFRKAKVDQLCCKCKGSIK